MASSGPAAMHHQYQQHNHMHSPPQHQGLPSISSLTNGLPPSSHNASPDPTSAESTRDSGTWPGSQSKHTSANSGLQVHTLLNPDDSPSRHSVPTTPLSGRGLNSSQSGNAILPSINQGFSDMNNRDSRDSGALSMDSRRSSVDSRMHQGMNNLYIHNGPASPYESQNASQVSLAASLRRPQPPNGVQPVSPHSSRSGVPRSSQQPRVAPPIIGRVPGAPDPTAAKPTQGFAWAFPDSSAIPEERRDSESGDSSVGMSRQNSFAASSIRSSIFSNDSHLPPGQRRLDDDQATTHHHTMQHRAIQSLQQQEIAGQGVGNYSRTPELRVSHKLAERKRRSEMKDLFEELNKAVPANGGTKASKWEILMKAIEYIRVCQNSERNLQHENQRLQRDSDYARDAHKENEILRTEIQVMHQHLHRLDPNAPHVYGHFTQQLASQQNGGGAPQTNGAALPPSLASQQQQQQQQQQQNGGLSLPPLRETGSSHGSAPGSSSQQQPGGFGAPMQGVEYAAGGAYGR